MLACVLISHFRAKAEMRRHAELKNEPAVIIDKTKARPLVVGSFPGASGVTAGMTLEQAFSRRTDIIVLEADEPYYHKLSGQLVESLALVCDRIEVADLGCIYLQLDGFELTYGGEESLLSLLLQAVPTDLNPRISIGNGKFPAYVAARKCQGCGIARVPPDVAAFLWDIPVHYMPIDSRAKERLLKFGLHRIGQVASLQIGELQEQFGTEGKRIWELCNGIDSSPVLPIKQEQTVTEHLSLPYWAVTTDVFLAAFDSLGKRAFARTEMRGKYVGKVDLQCSIYGSPTWTRTFTLKEPAGSHERLAFAVRSNLGDLALPGTPEDVFLTLSGLTYEQGSQGEFFDSKGERERRRVELQQIGRRLQLRMGDLPVLQQAVEVHPNHPLPEMRAFLMSIDPETPAYLKSLREPVPISVRTGAGQRPLALCRSKGRRMRWIRVAGIEDLWKIRLWWLSRPIERTYYRLEQTDGRLVTVFRNLLTNEWFEQSY